MLNIKVRFMDTNNVSLENILSSSFLLDSDIADVSRFKMEENKKEKAYSYIYKNREVGKYFLNEFGKPISKDCYFNISHSKGVVVFIKDMVPIGIDIEKIRPIEDNMIEYISSIEEKKYIKNEKRFFEIWTNKESLTKAIGTGIKDKIKNIPGLPIVGVKEYKEKKYYSIVKEYKGYVISITRESEQPFNIEITEERI